MSVHPPLSRRALAFVPVVGLLLAGIAVAIPAGAVAPYTATGSVELPSSGFTSATRVAFVLDCPNLPATQGQDGFVFQLPQPATEGEIARVTGDQDGHVLQAAVFKDDCSLVDNYSAEPDGDLRIPLAAGSTFLYVEELIAAPEVLTLTVGPAVVTPPSPTATPTATPSGGTGGGTGSGLRTRYTYSATPNDPLYPEPEMGAIPLAFDTGQWPMHKVRVAEAWQRPRATGAGVQVAVIDSGLDLGHPDLSCEGKVREIPGGAPAGQRAIDVDGHGTHVAGIIGACTDNNEGVVGVAPDATIVPVRVFAAPAAGSTPAQGAVDLATGIRAAADAGAHVINMSLSQGIGTPLGVLVPGSSQVSGLLLAGLDDAIAYARSKGVVVVASAGNDFAVPFCNYPSMSEGVVCVGATDRRDLRSSYSNFAFKVEGNDPTRWPGLVAPGGSGTDCSVSSETFVSTYARDKEPCYSFGEGYAGVDGTSMASPMVAGVAALVYDRLGATRSPANAAKVVQALLDSAVDLGTPGFDPVYGAGRLDAVAAVEAVTPVAEPTATPSPSPTASPEPATSAVALSAPASAQRTDSVEVQAVVTSDGAPLAGQPVRFALAGGPTGQAVTDASGTARWTLPLDVEPGAYTLAASYAGSPAVDGSGDSQPLDVLAEDTTTTLVSQGKASQPTLVATVTDRDAASSGVAGVPVAFYSDGVQVGTATTDAAGRATYVPQRKAKSSYEARFAGDTRWRPSAATLPT